MRLVAQNEKTVKVCYLLSFYGFMISISLFTGYKYTTHFMFVNAYYMLYYHQYLTL